MPKRIFFSPFSLVFIALQQLMGCKEVEKYPFEGYQPKAVVNFFANYFFLQFLHFLMTKTVLFTVTKEENWFIDDNWLWQKVTLKNLLRITDKFIAHSKLSTPRKTLHLPTRTVKLKVFFYISWKYWILQSVFYVYLFLGLVGDNLKRFKICMRSTVEKEKKCKVTVFLEIVNFEDKNSKVLLAHRKQYFQGFKSRWQFLMP